MRSLAALRTDELGLPTLRDANRDPLPLSVRAYQAEVARRVEASMYEEARRNADAIRQRCKSFAEFVKLAWEVIEPGTPLKWNWHLDAMCDHLEAISLGLIRPRLIINVPPGSSKSTIVSVLWQAWEWGPLGKRHLRYVSTSFDLTNVKRDTGKTLDVIRSRWFQLLWPEVELKTEGVLSFSNYDTGSRLGVAFKSVTGKRGDRLLVDDPHSVLGAESEVERTKWTTLFIEGGLNRTNDWETSAIIVVMQRLHEDDLTGVLLAREYGFVHLCLPMEFEVAKQCRTPLQVPDGRGGKKDWTDPRSYEGELMDPARVPAAAVEELKKSDYSWAGQYQQRPAPRDGAMFKNVDQIEIVDHCPHGGVTVAGWDFAGSKRKRSPWTVRVLMTRIGGNVYVRHVERRRTNPTELEHMVEEVSIEDRKLDPKVLISLPQDPGQAGKAQKWRLGEILSGFNFKITPETGDKETRAEPFAAIVGNEQVFFVRGEWIGVYRDELRSFPAGSYKDQVDASSRAFAELVGITPPQTNDAPELMEAEDAVTSRVMAAQYAADPWGA
jgi:predicted phage terminase large subunit-like protein